MKGLEVSLSDLLKDQLVERQIRYRTSQPRILLLQILQAPGLINLQTAILATPTAVTLLRYPKATADQTDLLALRQTPSASRRKPMICSGVYLCRLIYSSSFGVQMAGLAHSAWTSCRGAGQHALRGIGG